MEDWKYNIKTYFDSTLVSSATALDADRLILRRPSLGVARQDITLTLATLSTYVSSSFGSVSPTAIIIGDGVQTVDIDGDVWGIDSTGNVTATNIGFSGFLSTGSAGSLTIASGVVAVIKTYHSIIVEGGAGSGNDDLVTATGGSDGDILILKSETSGASDTVTVKDGTGADTFILAGGVDFALDNIDDRITLQHNGTEWVELSRSTNS